MCDRRPFIDCSKASRQARAPPTADETAAACAENLRREQSAALDRELNGRGFFSGNWHSTPATTLPRGSPPAAPQKKRELVIVDVSDVVDSEQDVSDDSDGSDGSYVSRPPVNRRLF
jgi:hypothetical protein